jgi:hypothetical protein
VWHRCDIICREIHICIYLICAEVLAPEIYRAHLVDKWHGLTLSSRMVMVESNDPVARRERWPSVADDKQLILLGSWQLNWSIHSFVCNKKLYHEQYFGKTNGKHSIWYKQRRFSSLQFLMRKECFQWLKECFHFDCTKRHKFSPGTLISSCGNTGSISDDPYWISRENSLKLRVLSSINKVQFRFPLVITLDQ